MPEIVKYQHTPRQRQAVELMKSHRFNMLFGGAGSGKTWIAVSTIVLRALMAPNTLHTILRKELSTARVAIWDQTLPQVLKARWPDVPYHLNNQHSKLTFPHNGSVIRLGGVSDRNKLEKLLGPSQTTIYLNECTDMLADVFWYCDGRLREVSVIEPKMICDCNPTFKSHWSNRFFIEGVHLDKTKIKDHERFGYLKMNPRDNTHLTEDYLSSLENMPSKMKKRFYDGDFTDDAEGALWRQKDIDNNRTHHLNYKHLIKDIPLGFTVVAIDPATSKTENSDLTGIVAVGCAQKLRPDGLEDFYVLADRSIKGTPLEWAQAAIELAKEVDADVIVAEKNQGGDMVEAILRSVDLRQHRYRGKVDLVHATKGKLTRAEPIEALYEQGFVHHLASKELFDLEEEMTSYVPYMLSGIDSSPDRMDALVWAISYMSSKNNHAKHIRRFDPDSLSKAFQQAGL